MGLGKTIQAFSALVRHKDATNLPILIVCPSAVVSVWAGNDYQSYFRETFDDLRIFSPSISLKEMSSQTLVILSYSTLVRAFKSYLGLKSFDPASQHRLHYLYPSGIPNYTSSLVKNVSRAQLYASLMRQSWGHLVLDEMHCMKSCKSITAKAVGFLDTQFRLGLTGTPIMNHVDEIFTLLRYGLRLQGLNWDEMRLNPSGEYCRSLLKRFTLGRTKEEVGIKSRKASDYENVILPWPENHQSLRVYRAAKARTLALIQEIDTRPEKPNTSSFFASLHQMRQICLHWQLASPKPKFDGEPSPKMEYVYKLIQESKDKVVVVSSYKRFHTQIMAPWLKSLKLGYSLFAGNGQKKQFQALSAFRSDPNIKVLLLVKQAGALGLNLHDSAATIILMDPHFNQALDEQAAHRVDRIGQQNRVVVRRLFMKGSIDMALLNMQQEKAKHVSAWTRPADSKTLALNVTKLHLEKFDTV